MGKLGIHLLLSAIVMTLQALSLFVSLTGDSAQADKHLG